jgi:hypothetical protein
MAFSMTATAAGFMIKPMTIELEGRPGDLIEVKVEIRNLATDRSEKVAVTLCYLDQKDNGNWRPILAKDLTSGEKARLQSCFEWLALRGDEFIVEPMKSDTAKLRIRVPHGLRGSYTACLDITSKPHMKDKTIAVAAKFIVPITIHVLTTMARKEVQVQDLSLMLSPGTKNQPAKEQVVLSASNTGEALVRIGAKTTISRQAGQGWRSIMNLTLEPRRIIPGATLHVDMDCPRRLPSGKYLLETVVSFDGRAQPPVTKEVDYLGDPSVADIAADIHLQLTPTQLELQTQPGSTRSAYLTVTNPTEELLTVRCHVKQPLELSGVAMGEILGDGFCCHEWAKPVPAEFTLRDGAMRRFAV